MRKLSDYTILYTSYKNLAKYMEQEEKNYRRKVKSLFGDLRECQLFTKPYFQDREEKNDDPVPFETFLAVRHLF